MRTWSLDLFLAAVATVVMIWVIAELWERFIPEPMFMSVNNVHINDTVVGTEPVVTADRKIYKDVYGVWSSVVVRVDDPGPIVCNGGITIPIIYQKNEGRPSVWTLSHWAGKDCKRLKDMPGRYVNVTRWTLFLDQYTPKRSQVVTVYSNEFEIKSNPEQNK